MKKRHINIPVFIPHLGCPNTCVFCNQHAISGASSFRREGIVSEIDTVLSSVDSDKVTAEIAFFGGSFTGIDRDTMLFCLDTAEEYVKRGQVSGIRMSTRPDYINDEILDVLQKYTISEVELGIQSFSDAVLGRCRRGHTAKTAETACRLLRERGIPFVGQMMVGLPGADVTTETECAERISSLGASGCRIYPTVVFKGTALHAMTVRGEYVPLNLAEAVERSAAVLEVFLSHGVRCLRVGLCESENLHSKEYYAGPNHPAMGELVGAELYYRRMCAALDRVTADIRGCTPVFYVPTGDISMAVGQKRVNKQKIIEKYGVKSPRFIENSDLIRYNILLDIK
ncbi:MAG: radical SAM protein [Ruminococcaceae bacterium]|nr:radical SAM protein [Oscillospiraceae bacterium]